MDPAIFIPRSSPNRFLDGSALLDLAQLFLRSSHAFDVTFPRNIPLVHRVYLCPHSRATRLTESDQLKINSE
jgi:hypothetical protein